MGVKYYLRLYKDYVRIFLYKAKEYKGDFLFGILSIFVKQCLLFWSIYFIFMNFPSVKGWDKSDFYFLYAVSVIGYGICYTFFDGLWMVGQQYVQQGDFDRILIRPVSTLFQILAERINIDGITSIIIGVYVLIKSRLLVLNGNVAVNIIILVIICIMSGLLYSGMLLIFSSFSFIMLDSIYLMTLVNSFGDFGRYPIVIFPKFIQIILTFILPYGFASFYPALFFLKYSSRFYMLFFEELLVLILVWVLGLTLWKNGILHYKSSGA